MQTKTTFERLQSLLPDVFNPKPQRGDLYLRFRLAPSLYAAIPLAKIVETLRIPATSITPIPNMPVYILGLVGNRSKVFWALDLAQRLGLSQGSRRLRYYSIIIVEILTLAQQGAETSWLGLSVQQIQTTFRLHQEELSFDIGGIEPNLQPYCEGWFQHNSEKTLLLNVDAIASAN